MTSTWLDDYERSARLMPGLLALAPVVVAILAFGLPVALLPTGIAGALLSIIGPAILSKYVRNRGKALEERLYRGWGGPPSTLLLRPSPGSSGEVFAQRRANVEKATGLAFPAETTDGDRESYLAAALALRSKTGDRSRFPTLYAENKNYGFERNLLAIRPEALAISAISSLALGLAAMVDALRDTSLNLTSLTVSLGVTALLVIFWARWPAERRVRTAGDRYAERLVDAAAALP